MKLPKEIPSSFDIFSIPNMLTILPEQSLANVHAQNPIFKQYLDLINKDINDNNMLTYKMGSSKEPKTHRCSSTNQSSVTQIHPVQIS